MFIDELTPYQKKKLSNCIYCGRPIEKNDSFQMIVSKRGRYSMHTFIHDDCIYAAKCWLRDNMVERRL